MIRRAFIIVSLFFFLGSISMAQEVIRIAVAANLLHAMADVKDVFESQNELKAELISASSGVLTAQILNSAPYDIFFSANRTYPETIFQGGKCFKPIHFTNGQLIFWSKEKRGNMDAREYLSRLSNRSVAIANPDLAPYGKKALRWLESIMNEDVSDLLVYAENINQVNQYIYSQTVDAALTAFSSSYAESIHDVGYWTSIEPAVTIPHYSCIVTESKKRINADQFLEFVLSEQGQRILIDFGYISPEEN